MGGGAVKPVKPEGSRPETPQDLSGPSKASHTGPSSTDGAATTSSPAGLSVVQTLIAAAAQHLQAALEVPTIPDSARAALEEALALVKSIGSDTQRAPSKKRVPTQTLSLQAALVQSQELVDVYTDNDPLSAEGHHIIVAKSPTRGQIFQTPLPDSALDCSNVRELLAEAGTLNFDAMSFVELKEVAGQPIRVVGMHLMRKNSTPFTLQGAGVVQDAAQFSERVSQFLGDIDRLYRPEPAYHNSSHATDVLSTMEWFLQMNFVSSVTNFMDHFMGLIAAAVHDVAHPGYNNLYFANTMAPLAIRYNDKSILENMHVALAFETMLNSEKNNWFALLSKSFEEPEKKATNLQHYVRRAFIDMILATDMSKHAHQLAKLMEVVEEHKRHSIIVSDDPLEIKQRKQELMEKKLVVLESALHAADISNPARPRPIMLGWTQRILREFWSQGDKEKELGLPISPLCDRQTGLTSIAKGQIGFINFVVKPFYAPIAILSPEVHYALDLLASNKEFWEEQDKAGTTYDQLFKS